MVVEEEAEEKAEEVTNEGAEEKTEKVTNEGAVRYQWDSWWRRDLEWRSFLQPLLEKKP